MRIVQLANFYGPTSGGLRTAVDALGRGYLAAGHERALVIPGPKDCWRQDENGVTVMLRSPQLPGTSYRVVVEPWRVRDVLERLRPTSIEVSDKSTMVAGARWAARNGTGSVLLSHERLDTHLAPRLGWRRGLVTGTNTVNRVLRRSFDEIVVTSSFAAEEFARLGGRPVHRIPLGVDLTTFHPDRRHSPDMADAPGSEAASSSNPSACNIELTYSDVDRRPAAAEDVARLVYAGRLSMEKRPDLAIATAVELHRQGFAFRLDVYGDGPDRETLVRMAGDAPVIFHPYIADRTALAVRLAAADVALSVCPVETFGLAILEALACGTPVVTADQGGGRELLDAGAGAWAPPEPARLAAAVRAVLTRPLLERRDGARRRAERYPWCSTIDAMLGVHSSVARTTDRWSVAVGSQPASRAV
ncbi:glycosyltransferase [Actinopolymorpha pittospori]